MADVTTSQVGEITNAKVRSVLMPVIRQVELAAEKVAANHHQAAFALPKGNQFIENILQARFQSLPAQQKASASSKALTRLNAPAAARSSRFGELGGIDLRSGESIEVQMKKVKVPVVKLTERELLAAVGATAAAKATAAKPLDKLEFRLHRVRCIDETGLAGPFGVGEAGADEIHLGGTEVDESGGTRKISPFKVRNFGDDGDIKTYDPPRRFTWFNLKEGTKFPKSYFVTLVLAEKDMGGLPEFIDKLLNWVKDKVVTALTAALGGAIGASGGPVGAIIGVAVGWAVGKCFEFFKSVWQDDVFAPTTIRVDIPSLTHRFPGGAVDSAQASVVFSGHNGKYDLTYDWRLFT